jgi:hypothetical protein
MLWFAFNQFKGVENMKKIVIAALSVVFVTSIAVGYEIHHPNLKSAYADAENAIQHIHSAQAANKGVEFGGHADLALEALKHVEQELIEGDKYNDAHHK